MLPFTWHVSIRKNDLDVLPCNVVVHAVMDIEAKALCQVVHELCPRGDAVTVEMRTGRLLWRQFNTCRGGGGGGSNQLLTPGMA